MRVLFTSTAGLGHLLPLLPLARALVGVGHDVAVACPAERASTVVRAGLGRMVIDSPTDADRATAARQLQSSDPAAMAAENFGRLNPEAAPDFVKCEAVSGR